MTANHYHYLPAAPLVAAVRAWAARHAAPDALGHVRPAKVFGWDEPRARAYQRAKQAGRVTVGAADDLAVALGCHPADIWGDAWWASENRVSATKAG